MCQHMCMHMFACVNVHVCVQLHYIASNKHLWQSQVEIEHYSVAYFNRVTMFKVLLCTTSVKGGAHMRYIDLSAIHASSLSV